jgi:hypothetical protein
LKEIYLNGLCPLALWHAACDGPEAKALLWQSPLQPLECAVELTKDEGLAAGIRSTHGAQLPHLAMKSERKRVVSKNLQLADLAVYSSMPSEYISPALHSQLQHILAEAKAAEE